MNKSLKYFLVQIKKILIIKIREIFDSLVTLCLFKSLNLCSVCQTVFSSLLFNLSQNFVTFQMLKNISSNLKLVKYQISDSNPPTFLLLKLKSFLVDLKHLYLINAALKGEFTD